MSCGTANMPHIMAVTAIGRKLLNPKIPFHPGLFAPSRRLRREASRPRTLWKGSKPALDLILCAVRRRGSRVVVRLWNVNRHLTNTILQHIIKHCSWTKYKLESCNHILCQLKLSLLLLLLLICYFLRNVICSTVGELKWLVNTVKFFRLRCCVFVLSDHYSSVLLNVVSLAYSALLHATGAN